MARDVIFSLQVGRGVAALAVVAHHAAVSTAAFVETVPDTFLRFFDLGIYGVDFFFVLSGFIIMHTHMHEVGRATQIRVYLVKRISRIFPAYWPVGLAMLVLYAVLPGVSASGEREISVASSILLLPADKPPALSVAWTLIHELLFYCVFLLWFVSRRAFWSGMAAWVAAVAVTETVGGAIGWLRYLFGLLNVEFLFGVLAAVSYKRGWFTKQDGLLVVGGVLLVLGTSLALYARVVVGDARLVLAFGLGMLMLGLALRERRQVIRWPALLLALGNASFSIYLVHYPLLSLFHRLAGRFEMHWVIGLLSGILVSVVFGYFYFLILESPVLQFFRSWRRPAGT